VSARRTAAGARAGLLVALAAWSCASDDLPDQNRRRLELVAERLPDGDPRELARHMEELLAETEEASQDYALQRFYAAWLLTQIHAVSSLSQPFLTEVATSGHRVGGIGRRDDNPSGERPSPNAHLAASVHHARAARAAFDRAARSGPKLDGVTLLPDSLWMIDLNDADANLQVILTTAYARLGFSQEVARILAESEGLVRLETCLGELERWRVPVELRPWVLAMIHDYLKSRDELEAYRFGVVAVEGAERFGHALPEERIAAIDRWIVAEAGVVFVCPQSHTAYIPGMRQSPISGVGHLDYVAVPRPAAPAAGAGGGG
jgi:hypothetical protein